MNTTAVAEAIIPQPPKPPARGSAGDSGGASFADMLQGQNQTADKGPAEPPKARKEPSEADAATASAAPASEAPRPAGDGATRRQGDDGAKEDRVAPRNGEAGARGADATKPNEGQVPAQGTAAKDAGKNGADGANRPAGAAAGPGPAKGAASMAGKGNAPAQAQAPAPAQAQPDASSLQSQAKSPKQAQGQELARQLGEAGWQGRMQVKVAVTQPRQDVAADGQKVPAAAQQSLAGARKKNGVDQRGGAASAQLDAAKKKAAQAALQRQETAQPAKPAAGLDELGNRIDEAARQAQEAARATAQAAQAARAAQAAPTSQPDAPAKPAAAGLAGAEGGTVPSGQAPSGVGTGAGSPQATGGAAESFRPASPQAVTEQVAVQISKAAQSGQDRISIQLRPESLGRIEVRLDIGQDGRVQATITADNPDTLDLMQRDSRAMERALQEAGLRTDTGSLNFSLREQNHKADGNGGHGGGGALGAAVEDAEAELAAAEWDAGAYFGSGRIDITV